MVAVSDCGDEMSPIYWEPPDIAVARTLRQAGVGLIYPTGYSTDSDRQACSLAGALLLLIGGCKHTEYARKTNFGDPLVNGTTEAIKESTTNPGGSTSGSNEENGDGQQGEGPTSEGGGTTDGGGGNPTGGGGSE